MKVRIGNDIRLNLTLKGPRNYDYNNIKSLKCYFINTSLCDFDFCAPCCCDRRFHGCGKPCYHVEPCNMCNCCKPCGHPKYPYTPADPAFGQGPLRPNYGHGCRCCNCHGDFDNYCRYGFLDFRAKCHPHMGCGINHCCDRCGDFTPYFRPGHCDCIRPHFDENFRYHAPSKVLEGRNKIQTYFPAQDQLMCGDYKLVVVLVVFEAGWGKCDLHTYTIDYGTVFTLVDDDSAINGDVTIDVDNDKLVNSDMSEINTPGYCNYRMYPNTNMMLGGKDIDGKKYNIEVSLTNGDKWNYYPENWPYNPLRFKSSNPDILGVSQDGTLISHTPANDTEVVITVDDPKDEHIKTQFTVTVLGVASDYIFFCNIRPATDNTATWGLNRTDQNFEDGKPGPVQEASNVVDGSTGIYGLGDVYAYGNSQVLDGSRNDDELTGLPPYKDFWKLSSIAGEHLMRSEVNGQYLWIVSRTKLSSVTCDGMNVPISFYGSYQNRYFYACPNPLMSGIIFDVTVKI